MQIAYSSRMLVRAVLGFRLQNSYFALRWPMAQADCGNRSLRSLFRGRPVGGAFAVVDYVAILNNAVHVPGGRAFWQISPTSLYRKSIGVLDAQRRPRDCARAISGAVCADSEFVKSLGYRR